MPILTRVIPAPSGAAGAAGVRVYNEELTGTKNGVNTVFTTAAIFVPGDEAVYFNGVRQSEGVGCDYVRSESGGVGTGFDTITFAVAPLADDIVSADYDPV